MIDTTLGVGRRTFVRAAGATLGAGTFGVRTAPSDDGEGKRQRATGEKITRRGTNR